MRVKILNGLPRLIISGIVINNGVKIKIEFVFPSRPQVLSLPGSQQQS
jgi:hypothetical protein